MLPQFDESGWLPPGVHPATLDEIAERFGRDSEIRRTQMESVRWMLELAKKAGISRIVLNGSFVTDIIEPNDVDCVLLVAKSQRRNRVAIAELRAGLPFLDMKLVGEADFQEYVNVIYGMDRFGAKKGVVEVIQWT